MESISDTERARVADERDERLADERRGKSIGFGVSVGWHALVVLAAAMLVVVEVTQLVPASPSGPTVVRVDEPPLHPGLNKHDPDADDERLRPRGEPSVTIGGFTFDFHKIAEQASLLFPFIDPGLALDHFGVIARPETARLEVPAEFLAVDSSVRDRRKPPLALSSAALQTAVDAAWARHSRWSAFQPIAGMTDRYDPTTGQLPALLRGYIEQNGLQIYADPRGIKDPRLWTELQLAADHVAFIGFISRYASEHPSTRGTTELLFMLDKIAQASRDALITLLDVDPDEDLPWTSQSNPDARDFIVQLRRHYNAALIARDLTSRNLLNEHYDQLRLEILGSIVRTTPDGYRTNDARLLVGAIHWRAGRRQEAIQTWREMDADPNAVFATTTSELLTEVRRVATVEDSQAARREIDRILSSDYARWVSASIDRLHNFGFKVDQY